MEWCSCPDRRGNRRAHHLANARNGAYVAQALLSDGVLRSHVYPGLWLDVPAFWTNGGAKMLQVLNAGTASEDHRKFVEGLAAAKLRG